MAVRGFGGRTKRNTLVNVTSSVLAANVRSGVIYTNTGASGTITINLPANPARGTTIGFSVTTNSRTLRALPDAGDTILYTGLSAGSALSSNSQGTCWTLVANGSNGWIVSQSGGL